MRIRTIRFKNLNSLVGEWEIDLMHRAFSTDGIFAISGPTGAGKTTVLDAICLALYGRTPRLRNISQSENEIMSRQAADCFSEVTLEIASGRYRCRWSQRRARNKPDGALQQVIREIVDANNGAVLESAVKKVGDRIVQLTGMDFDRFTKTMMLAQGDFAAFLNSDIKKRSELLEQITGTEIYSRISVRVHERRREEQEKLRLLEAEVGSVRLLGEDEKDALLLQGRNLDAAEVAMAEQLEVVKKRIQWRREIESLCAEIDAVVQEMVEATDAAQSFAPIKQRLKSAQKASELDGDYAGLLEKRTQVHKEVALLAQDEMRQPTVSASLAEAEKILQKAEAAVSDIRNVQKETADKIKVVRAMDTKLDEQIRAVENAERDFKKSEERLREYEKRRHALGRDLNAANRQLESLRAYLSDHAADEMLVEEFAALKEQTVQLKEIFREEEARREALNRQEKSVETAAKDLLKKTKLAEAAAAKCEVANVRAEEIRAQLEALLHGRLLREYRADRDRWEQEARFLRKIASLEEERARLVDGAACPLCGSKTHPFAEGIPPTVDETEQRIEEVKKVILKAEELESQITLSTEERHRASEARFKAEAALASAAQSKTHEEEKSHRLFDELAIISDRRDTMGAVSTQRFAKFGVVLSAYGDLEKTVEELSMRLDRYRDCLNKQKSAEQKIHALVSEQKQIDGAMEVGAVSLAESKASLLSLRELLNDSRNKRISFFGDKHPDVEEARLEKAVRECETMRRSALTSRDFAKQAYDELNARIGSVREKIALKKEELDASEAAFGEMLAQYEFVDEASFAAVRLPIGEQKRLAEQAQKLDDRLTALTGRKKDREVKLASEVERKLTDEPLAFLEEQDAALLSDQKRVLTEKGEIRQRLVSDDTARGQLQEKIARIALAKTECERWNLLYELIGSHDGKKFRNFAQGLTFEMMVRHANIELRKMSDRYYLVRDAVEPLSLNVIDSFQAGEIRSIRNLSGGESFIVSLALALGLSRMSAGNIRVDSLFLDEGFGSLDEETLDIALETLAGLQESGKLIGVISHVPRLKERIATQIQVVPEVGGNSVLFGPGCRRC